MLKKITLLFLIATSFIGCNDIYYDAETRLVIEGKLVDQNGNPVPEQQIDIVVSQDTFGHSSDVITYGVSDASGAFKFVIPGPKNDDNTVTVRINQNSGYPISAYQDKLFTDIRKWDFMGYRLNLNTVVLYRQADIANLYVATEQTDEHHALTAIAVEGKKANRVVSFDPVPLDYIPNEYMYDVLKNQTVNLKYTVTDYTDANNPESTDYNIPILIDSNPFTNYTLTY